MTSRQYPLRYKHDIFIVTKVLWKQLANLRRDNKLFLSLFIYLFLLGYNDISKTENEAYGAKISDVGGKSSRVTGSPEHATRKWLPGMIPKLAAPLGSLSSFRRGLLWRWCRPLMS